MRNEPQSLYQVLRVSKDARPDEIERAYQRIKRELNRETTPPDPRLRVMIEHAHDTLMDPVRRETYDREWYAPKAQIQRARRSPVALVATLAAVVSVGAATWMYTREPAQAAREWRPKQEIQEAVSMAVGRVSRIDMSGTQQPLGVAFAIAEGTLVTSCEGLTPNAEVMVHFGKRVAPVRVTSFDEATHLCKLTGATVGSWPLPLSHQYPSQGQPMYVPVLGANNEPRVRDASFKTAVQLGEVHAFQADAMPDARDLGTPLLDAEGRVVGAASRLAGKIAYAPVPKSYLPEVIPVERSAPEPQPADHEESAPEPPSGEPVPGMPGPNISPERRQRLEKAFRPPPTVPKDL